jgi:two-component system LytT family response regulator
VRKYFCKKELPMPSQSTFPPTDQATTHMINQTTIEQLSVQFNTISQEIAFYNGQLKDLLAHQTGTQRPAYLNKMLVKSNKRLIIMHVNDIDWIEAWGDYIRMHCQGKAHIVRRKIGEIETQLDPQQFLRIGRSAIINVDHIKELEPLNHGDYLITLNDNTQLNLSRNYRDRLITLFDNHF